MQFKCSVIHPGCTAPPFSTGKAWKIHATRAHKGWNDKQYLILTKAASDPAAGSFTDAPPKSETEQAAPAPAAQAPGPGPGQAPPIDMDKMKREFAAGLARIVWAPLQNYFGAPALSPEDQATIAEGFSAALGGVQLTPNYKPIEKELNSPLWLLLFPLAMVVSVFVKKVKLDEVLKKLTEPQKQADRGRGSAHGSGQVNAGRGADPQTPTGDRIRFSE